MVPALFSIYEAPHSVDLIGSTLSLKVYTFFLFNFLNFNIILDDVYRVDKDGKDPWQGRSGVVSVSKFSISSSHFWGEGR